MRTPSKRSPEAFLGANLFEVGLGHVVVSRFKTDWVEAGVFLLDVYCLGVKDAFFTRMHLSEYEGGFLDRVFADTGREPLEPGCARKLLEDAVEYARRLGFAPHEDYKQACRVLGGIDPRTCTRTFEFGHDGKPLYIQGPHESEARARRILNLLQAHCGDGNYHFMVLVPGFDTPQVEEDEEER
jgi:hypothetical protein